MTRRQSPIHGARLSRSPCTPLSPRSAPAAGRRFTVLAPASSTPARRRSRIANQRSDATKVTGVRCGAGFRRNGITPSATRRASPCLGDQTRGMPTAGAAPRLRRGQPIDATPLARVQSRAAVVAYAHIFPPEAPKPTAEALTPSWTDLLTDPTATVIVAEDAVIVDRGSAGGVLGGVLGGGWCGPSRRRHRASCSNASMSTHRVGAPASEVSSRRGG